MTDDRDFKDLVRARMRETGQRYTAARADLLAAAPAGPSAADTASTPDGEQIRQPDPVHDAARLDHERVVARFLDADGRLRFFPARRKARTHVLLQLVRLFEPGEEYAEKEVDARLVAVHDDFAFWRRELVDYGYLHRSAGRYRLAAEVPERAAFLRDEIPAWEAVWLPGYLAGRG
ncbi:DUF2087 domain-containing protein [Arsenicicoccus dermatophilus]|uniref:DUF2087 domain-containing protein n=1 Tax=Arsenicicoccus dermatophilus TaxID=1076331 RepID=UPI001F4C7975|nr:DUF2087 domain-containing protein [Arsenicicoccus dermatophilus]MCH8611815.1 DUF2087 domain-containing protein [Arsenicicoccus dermatophilus]